MRIFVVVIILVMVCVAAYGAFELPIGLEEHLGHTWGTEPFHRMVEIPQAGQVFPDKVALYAGDAPVPVQLLNTETYPDGSVKRADVYFLTDLPAHSSHAFTLRPTPAGFISPHPLLSLRKDGNRYEIANGLTAVQVPAGELPAGQVPGPILGVRLPNGQWTAATRITPAGAVQGFTAEILAQGPIVISIRLTYRFADDGHYTAVITLRAGEPLVRLDERYEKAGTLTVSLDNIKPTALCWEGFRPSSSGKSVPINYVKPGKVGGALVGYNYVPSNIAPAYLLTGDPGNHLVGLVSTDSDWLPFPYNQSLEFVISPQNTLLAQGSLASGQRHWAIYAGKVADFVKPQEKAVEVDEKELAPPEPPHPLVKDFYLWWWQHLVVPLETVGNWRLTWPGMEQTAFPHTFFSKEDLPGIRQRLQSEPMIAQYVEGTRAGWGTIAGRESGKEAVTTREAYERYRTAYFPKGTASSYTDVAAAYLFSGDDLYLRQLHESMPLADGGLSPRGYLDRVVTNTLDNDCFYFEDYLSYLNMTDAFFQRIVGLELLLGSGLLTPEEKKETLSKLAYVVYLLNNPMFQPPNYPMGAGPYIGYGQGTPNMKHCLISVRGMMACMLTGHPDQKRWLDYTMEEYERNLPYSVNTDGVHLESPFYSSRDTMRFGPFWLAMTRAGVGGEAAQRWLARTKMTFQYLGDMLTPPEPRMGGKRVYHPIGRSSSGVVDPTFIIGVDPWGDTDEAHGRLMRWIWEQQGRPSPNITGTGGGRDMSLTLLALSKLLKFKPCDTPPLKSVRWEGMGAIFRSQVGSAFESNILFRHDPYCWDLYPVNNGGVYFYGKGAPLCPRFGGYWMGQAGQCDMMHEPFGNRIFFSQGSNYSIGTMTDYASLGNLADLATGVTGEKDWTRSVLFAKDLDRDDPVYLLVRDEVSRPDAKSFLHWWVMSKDVQPDGLDKPGVVPTKGNDAQWYANLGKNWENALKAKAAAPAPIEDPGEKGGDPAPAPAIPAMPVLKGQLQHFTGQCGVDLDLFIALPTDPVIVTDAAGVGPGLSYCVNRSLYEYQQLVRTEQPAGKPFLTLLVPR